jgi:hypothetical protein
LVIVNPVAAAKVDPTTGERTEKEGYVRTVKFSREDGTVDEVDIWFNGGAYVESTTSMTEPPSEFRFRGR